MKRILFFSFLAAFFIAVLPGPVRGQSGNSNERTGVMNGNRVRTIFGNWGVIGQPASYGKRGAWKYDNDGYLGDVSPLVGAEVTYNGITFHSVVTCPVDRPTTKKDKDLTTGKWWTWEPLAGYFNSSASSVAMSNNENSWPSTWPDKLSDATDPGWPGSWNGYFGKSTSADLETYFVMNDQNDEHYAWANKNSYGVAFRPDSTNSSRYGLGLKMSVRAMQWSQFLAKDNIFWLYDITNEGTTSYTRTVFGMLVGTYVGVTSTEDYGEYADDWSFYDVTQNITYTGDYGRKIADPLWVGSVGMVGYAFLESPGNPYDGIDNDGDADSCAIGLTAPQFNDTSFDSTTINVGDQLVLINDDYSRSLYTVPNVDSVTIHTRGYSLLVYPGKTKVAEGNVIPAAIAGTSTDEINPNAYDGVDNNFNGLIDENYYLHYHQLKKNNTVVLIDIYRPVRHKNYISNLGTSPYSMIDEKRNDLIDNNNNWNINTDDLGRDGVANTGDYGEGDGLPTSGYLADGTDTGLPGEEHVDKTDVKESDQIGLSSFYYFSPASNFSMFDDSVMWVYLAPGFFSVPTTIQNNEPIGGEDGDFIYGSGYFPLVASNTERFSLALVYGGGNGGTVDDDIADLLKHKKTVQKIYDANYQFPQPPTMPTLTAVPGDGKVTLYWNRVAEESVDPALGIKDFEGYKLYKSTETSFADIFTLTDGSGEAEGYVPTVQYDLIDSVTGYFAATGDLYQEINGYAIYLGSDNGLKHSYVDKDVDNGRQYYYALVAYDKGDATQDILPSENTFTLSEATTGVFTYSKNVAVVTPNAKVAGYVDPTSGVTATHSAGPATGSVAYTVVDDTALTAHTYRVEFLDTQVDTVDNNSNTIKDAADSTEWDRRTSFYFVRDMNTFTESFTTNDTIQVSLGHKHLLGSTVKILNSSGSAPDTSLYTLDTLRGTIRSKHSGTLPAGTYTISYQYYPVYRSPNMQGSPFITDTLDTDIFDGIEMVFQNFSKVQVDTANCGWNDSGINNEVDISTASMEGETESGGVDTINGYKRPSDYKIMFYNSIVDTAQADERIYQSAVPVKFRVYDVTDSTYVKFIYTPHPNKAKTALSSAEIVIMDKDPVGTGTHYTWDIIIKAALTSTGDTTVALDSGAVYYFKTKKPFRKGDVFTFTTVKPTVNQTTASSSVSNVHPVPNPYIGAASFEKALAPGITSGRGERRVDFVHVPLGATIRIFTARGDHVITLHQDSNIQDGTISWNLRSKENLDVAYGVYFYVVESTAGTKTGKLGIIK